jgi:hypothetical protein
MLSSGHPAAKLGWTQQTVSKIESGQKRVMVVELSRALDFDPAALVRRIAKLAD